jgi:hypothetical protein
MSPLEWRRWAQGLARRGVSPAAITATIGGSTEDVAELIACLHKRTRIPPAEATALVDLYAAGYSMPTIARAAGRGVGTVYRAIVRLGRPTTKVNRLPTTAVTIARASRILERRLACP